MEVFDRFFKPPQSSFFLLGPRGTGKSTWTQQHYPGALRIDLLAPDVFRKYAAYPEFLNEYLKGRSEKTVILDEIQKVPALLSVVHQLIEANQGWQFILTGSSARKLKQSGVDLLGGRALVKTLHPFISCELQNQFDLDRALQQGLLPVIWSHTNPKEALQAYVALYLKEEVQSEGLVRNIGTFVRFLEAISFSHGSVLNLSNVARECSVERKTVQGYTEILEDLLLAFRIPIFEKRAKRAVSVHPKFYFFDTGVYRALRPTGPLDRPEEIAGLCLEGLVAQQLKAWSEYSKHDSKLYFWRTVSGVEVDFILYGAETFWAFEVKNSAHVNPKDLRGLTTFKTDYPEAKTVLLYRGKEQFVRNGILCIPCDLFLKNLIPDQPPIAFEF